MAVTRYASTDGSAPTITGQAGSLVAALDAILVTGYGAKPAAGWTKTFTGTNGAVFRPGAGTQYYFNVNDNGPGAGSFREARILGYETMSAFATGTNLFPTAAQAANGIFARKSATLDASARAWKAFADARTIYLFVQTGDLAGRYFAWMFGDVYSLKSSDTHNCMIVARSTENSGTSASEVWGKHYFISGSLTGVACYIARNTAGGAGAQGVAPVGNFTFTNGSTHAAAQAGSVTFKNASDNNIYLSPIWIHGGSGDSSYRGRMRGIWHYAHADSTCSDGDTINGTGTLTGKSFEVIKANADNIGIWCIETSNTWETN